MLSGILCLMKPCPLCVVFLEFEFMRRKRYIRPMTRKHLNIGGKIQARRKAMGLSQEALAQLTGVSRQSVTKWETGQSAPDLDRLVELADVLGVSLDFLLREPPQASSSSSSSALSSPPFPKNGVPEGPASFQEGGPSPVEASPAVAAGSSPFREEASSVSSCGGACGVVPAAQPSSTQLPGISEISSRLPEEGRPEKAPMFPSEPPSSSSRPFDQRSDLRPFLRRAAALCGIVLFMIGGLGLLALWALSEMYPVQLTDWDGSRHTGLWGFLLAHEIRSLFWLASGLLASGGVLVAGAWRAR